MQLAHFANQTDLFRSFFYENPEPMWVYQRHSLKFLLVNQAAMLKYGYSEAEFLAMTIADIRPAEDVAALHLCIKQGSAGCKKAGVWQHLTKNGDLLYVEITSHITASDGLDAVMVCARDITQQLALQQQNDTLLQQERRQRTLVEQSAHMLDMASRTGRLGGWRVDLASMTTEWSTQTALIHGYSQSQQLSAEQAISYYAPAYRQLVKERFNRCAQYGTGYDEIFQLQVHNDKPIWVRAIGEAEYDSHGNIVAVRGAFQDVDEFIRTKDELTVLRQRLSDSEDRISEVTARSTSMQQQAHQLDALAKLTGGIAHDYNNLLTVIISNTELLTEQLPKHSEQYKSAYLSLAAAHKAAGLTQHLLAFGQRQTLKPEQLSLHSLLDNAGSLLRHITPQNISLNTQVLCQPVMLHLDKTRFEMALLNIAINAREAMPDGGTLCLSASLASAELVRQHALDESRHYINITLSDTGPGMSDEVKRRAFEPFFTTKAMAQGYGLGLSMVYGFALQSGGIACIDERLDEQDKRQNDNSTGCSVSLILPVQSHQATLQSHDAHTQCSSAAKRLLLVEDDTLLQQHLTLILSKAGYQVSTADSADEAMTMLQTQPFDILLSDVVTPGQTDGIALAYWVRSHFPALKVLLNSGYYNIGQQANNSLVNDFHFIAKPYKTADLLHKLQSL